MKMNHNVTITLEKNHSESLVPFIITELIWNGEAPPEPLSEDIHLVAYDTSAIPELKFKLQPGDRIQFTADFNAEYSKDYWGEADIDYYFENVKNITVWRVIHEE